MIISRTPFRLSFFGGGTDYPVWYKQHGGAVLSTTIDKYCYINCRELPPFFNHKHRISYSKFEHVNNIDEIEHPAVREVFKFMNIKNGLEIHHDADLPARSGLGSSSAFTVGLLNALYALNNKMVSKERLALDAIHIEQDMIKEYVGSQDQYAAAFGGFNRINFRVDSSIDIETLVVSDTRKKELENYLLFFFTGMQRFASNIAKKQIKETPKKNKQLKRMFELVDEAQSILLNENTEIEEFGRLLHETWKLKRSLTDQITNPEIDQFYELALSAGASGGKLIGAGGGGFMVFVANPRYHDKIRRRLNKMLEVPIKFENDGSKIIYYNSNY